MIERSETRSMNITDVGVADGVFINTYKRPFQGWKLGNYADVTWKQHLWNIPPVWKDFIATRDINNVSCCCIIIISLRGYGLYFNLLCSTCCWFMSIKISLESLWWNVSPFNPVTKINVGPVSSCKTGIIWKRDISSGFSFMFTAWGQVPLWRRV